MRADVKGKASEKMNYTTKLADAKWALLGNRCWIGLTIERRPDKAEYVAIYLPKPYAAPEIIPESYSDDFFDALAKGKKWIAALRSGDYKQGKGTLLDKDNEYCCLDALDSVTQALSAVRIMQ